ncbi:MAG: hypothetical protein ACI33O_13295 [Bhargavaea sp.]
MFLAKVTNQRPKVTKGPVKVMNARPKVTNHHPKVTNRSVSESKDLTTAAGTQKPAF